MTKETEKLEAQVPEDDQTTKLSDNDLDHIVGGSMRSRQAGVSGLKTHQTGMDNVVDKTSNSSQNEVKYPEAGTLILK